VCSPDLSHVHTHACTHTHTHTHACTHTHTRTRMHTHTYTQKQRGWRSHCSADHVTLSYYAPPKPLKISTKEAPPLSLSFSPSFPLSFFSHPHPPSLVSLYV